MIIITAKGIPSKTLPLPTAEKPLVKGHNFFASGNVGEILVNLAEKFTHIRTTVLASMRNTKYDVKVVLDNKTGLVVQASCKCPAGSGGKCNHVAALLFALVDYIQTMRNPDSCTSKPQVWNKPTRKNKKSTHPQVVGQRKVQKHIFGRAIQRKRPLEDYQQFIPLKQVKLPNIQDVINDLQEVGHNTGLFQIYDHTSTESEMSDEDDGQENLKPEEVVVRKLQVQ